jgi:hypothetical protein
VKKLLIDCLLADREFIGKQWINCLNQNGISYYIRVRENFWVENPKNGKRFYAFWAFNDLKCGGSKVSYPIYRINGIFPPQKSSTISV